MSAVPDQKGCDCIDFDEGEWVESRLDTNLFGIVVGMSDFGRFYNVQLAGSSEIRTFYAVTLRHMDPQEDDDPEPTPDDNDDNVIRGYDFTKARTLRTTTTTRGAA